jgi:hypothetical protein
MLGGTLWVCGFVNFEMRCGKAGRDEEDIWCEEKSGSGSGRLSLAW